MATLAENAAAVKAAQVAIDAAIVAKGGSTSGGLSNAAAAIVAIPSGGADLDEILGWLTCTSTFIDFTKIVGADVITQTTGMQNGGQWFRNNKTAIEIYAPNIKYPQAYCFGGCTALKKITIAEAGNNSYPFSGASNIEEIVTVNDTANNVIFKPAFLSGIPKTCIVHASDADVKYIDGAWTIVERS